jgi:hypothetical protein
MIGQSLQLQKLTVPVDSAVDAHCHSRLLKFAELLTPAIGTWTFLIEAIYELFLKPGTPPWFVANKQQTTIVCPFTIADLSG